MLFILHSATINSVCGTPSPGKDHSAQVWKCNMSACLSPSPKWRVHCLVSVIPSPSGPQLLDLHCQGILPQAHRTSCSLKSILIYPHVCALRGTAASLPTPSSVLLSGTRSVSHLHTSWPVKTCSFAACLYKFPHSVYHHPTISSHIARVPLHLDPLPINLNKTYNVSCFFFFFKIHPYTNINVLFSNPHWETWQNVFCPCFFLIFSSVFCSFSSSRTDYVHTDVICHWQIQWDADMEQCTVCECETEKNNIKDSDTERMKKWDRKKKHWPNDLLLCLKWNPSLFLEQQDACTNSVCSVTQTTRLHCRGQDFLSTTCSVLD